MCGRKTNAMRTQTVAYRQTDRQSIKLYNLLCVYIFVACYRQYDTMICPQSAKTVNRKEQMFKWIKEKIGKKQEEEEEAVVPQPPLMRQMCLEFHLTPYRTFFLIGKFYDGYDISVASDNIVHLFECCYLQKVSVVSRWYGDSVETKPMESIKEVYFLT